MTLSDLCKVMINFFPIFLKPPYGGDERFYKRLLTTIASSDTIADSLLIVYRIYKSLIKLKLLKRQFREDLQVLGGLMKLWLPLRS